MIEGNNIQKRLFDIETAPPPGMWSRISDQLDKEADLKKTEAPVFVMPPRRNNNFTKIALAASFLGFAVMTALWYNGRQKENPAVNNTVNTSQPLNNTPPSVIRDTVYLPNTNVIVPGAVSPVNPIPQNGQLAGQNNQTIKDVQNNNTPNKTIPGRKRTLYRLIQMNCRNLKYRFW